MKWRLLLVLLFALVAMPAQAAVKLSFHSFNGSWVVGRWPHTFIVLEGTLDETGAKVNENYGFSPLHADPSILNGPVRQMIYVEKPKYIHSTNRHFTITISDATYHRIIAEVTAWRDAPGNYYDLNHRNCIHFVGKIAEIAGLKVDFPQDMLRRPKLWLNHVTLLNPQLGAKPIG